MYLGYLFVYGFIVFIRNYGLYFIDKKNYQIHEAIWIIYLGDVHASCEFCLWSNQFIKW